jgi:hypothetical protein
LFVMGVGRGIPGCLVKGLCPGTDESALAGQFVKVRDARLFVKVLCFRRAGARGVEAPLVSPFRPRDSRFAHAMCGGPSIGCDL